ncbi:hypothetical protein [Bdellovibrio sp. HCB337]|uniref:hypothetical protein n=1 Tax=Bdellovibrio sp. HCB337 TaxID=3394358 RepID=UPI0039A5AC6B
MARYPKGFLPKLTPKLIRKIGESMQAGAPVDTAAGLCGISKDTLYRWLRLAEGDKATPLLRKLSYTITKSQAEAELKDLEVIIKEIEGGSWKAAAWHLERLERSRTEIGAHKQTLEKNSSNAETDTPNNVVIVIPHNGRTELTRENLISQAVWIEKKLAELDKKESNLN